MNMKKEKVKIRCHRKFHTTYPLFIHLQFSLGSSTVLDS